jgi:hypothetical protein
MDWCGRGRHVRSLAHHTVSQLKPGQSRSPAARAGDQAQPSRERRSSPGT